jgi:hypothetical protein
MHGLQSVLAVGRQVRYPGSTSDSTLACSDVAWASATPSLTASSWHHEPLPPFWVAPLCWAAPSVTGQKLVATNRNCGQSTPGVLAPSWLL